MDSNSKAAATPFKQLMLAYDRIVVPDIQRDFCWGNDRLPFSMSRAQTFVIGIMHLFKKRQPATLGLIYGYDEKNELHIIDGQQRITTLYLLMGMLYRRIPDEIDRESIKDMLVASSAGIASPRLRYQAKKESMYFLKDLTDRFFLKGEGKLRDIENSEWFFSSYRHEPSVQAMLGALAHIDEILYAEADGDWSEIAKFVANEVKFMLCIVPNQTEAENLFITINTTGQPLSIGQKLKPLHMSQSKSPQEDALVWNHIEDWAWDWTQTHGSTSTPEELIDDIIFAHARFVDLIGKDAKEAFTLGNLYRFFMAYARVAECAGLAPGDFATIPGVAFVQRFGNDASDWQVREFCYTLQNITRYQRPLANGEDSKSAIAIANAMDSPSLLSMLKVHGPFNRIINDEEKLKLKVLATWHDKLDFALQIIRKAESHPILCGKVTPLLKWCQENGNVNIYKLNEYVDKIYELWGTEIDKSESLDPLRRALLAVAHTGYPIIRRGDTILTLCWHEYDWQRLMSISPSTVKQFVDKCMTKNVQEIIEEFDDPSHPYAFIIKDSDLLIRCRKRQLLRPCAPFIGYYDLEQQATIWHIGLCNAIDIDRKSWKPFKPFGSRCLYTDGVKENIAIDLYWQPQERSEFRIEVFARPDSQLPKADVKALIEQQERPFRYDKARKRNVCYARSAREAVSIIKKLMVTSTARG